MFFLGGGPDSSKTPTTTEVGTIEEEEIVRHIVKIMRNQMKAVAIEKKAERMMRILEGKKQLEVTKRKMGRKGS